MGEGAQHVAAMRGKGLGHRGSIMGLQLLAKASNCNPVSNLSSGSFPQVSAPTSSCIRDRHLLEAFRRFRTSCDLSSSAAEKLLDGKNSLVTTLLTRAVPAGFKICLFRMQVLPLSLLLLLVLGELFNGVSLIRIPLTLAGMPLQRGRYGA